jgi:hypothetical protein
VDAIIGRLEVSQLHHFPACLCEGTVLLSVMWSQSTKPRSRNRSDEVHRYMCVVRNSGFACTTAQWALHQRALASVKRAEGNMHCTAMRVANHRHSGSSRARGMQFPRARYISAARAAVPCARRRKARARRSPRSAPARCTTSSTATHPSTTRYCCPRAQMRGSPIAPCCGTRPKRLRDARTRQVAREIVLA